MSYLIKNAIVENVLCFISTSLHVLSTEEIVSSVVAFYRDEKIFEAKETLFKLRNEKLIARRGANPAAANVRDMIRLITSNEDEQKVLPTFLCDGFDAMPPRGFASIASKICELRDEVASFRLELQEHRRERAADISSLEDLGNVKEDICDTKKVVIDVKNDVNEIKKVIRAPVSPVPGQTCPTMAQVVKFGSQTVQSPVSSGGRPPVSMPTKTIPKKRTNARGVFGNKKPSPSVKIAGVVRDLDVFVGRCVLGTTCQELMDYCSEEGVHVKKCEVIKTKSVSSTSFKLTLAANVRDRLLTPDFWPEDIVVRKFYGPKRTPQKRSSVSSVDDD